MEPIILFSDFKKYLDQSAPDLYIVSEHTRDLINEKENILEVTRAEIQTLDKFLEKFQQKQFKIVAIGAGSVVDAAKYVSFKTDSQFCFIPSALSTNSFATHRNSFFDRQHGKISFDSSVASEIIADFDLLEQPQVYTLNKFGIVEIAATVIAQLDCDISSKINKESFNTELRERAQGLILGAVKLLSQRTLTRSSLKLLLSCLLESGALTREQGNGRLVSGSEHIISSYIEEDTICPHGMGLLFGILITHELHSNFGYRDKNADIIVEHLKNDTDMYKYIKSVTDHERLEHVLDRVLPRKDKFTILDITPRGQLLSVGRKIIKNYFHL
ncbi:MAG: iron-containing alcohol dehydrogenase [Candidatus Paceibacterota bacterium]